MPSKLVKKKVRESEEKEDHSTLPYRTFPGAGVSEENSGKQICLLSSKLYKHLKEVGLFQWWQGRGHPWDPPPGGKAAAPGERILTRDLLYNALLQKHSTQSTH